MAYFIPAPPRGADFKRKDPAFTPFAAMSHTPAKRMGKLFSITILLAALHCFSQVSAQSRSLSDCALELTRQKVTYDPSYFPIDYPNGDVPADKGVCTDVIIRAYRKKGVDLQKLVHEDMKANFDKYPENWGLKSTDKNIDHRRVPNLMVFFKRKGAEIKITRDPGDYLPGDVVAWSLSGGATHIGIVVDKKSRDGKRNLIVHNIGGGQVAEDRLFSYTIIGHYRYG